MDSGEDFLDTVFEVQREIAFLFGSVHKSAHFLRVDIVIRGYRMSRCVKRHTADDLFPNQIIHKRIINSRAQFVVSSKTTTDDLLLHLAYKGLLFRVTRRVCAQRINQPVRVVSRSRIVFAFGRRDTFFVLVAILGAENAEVDMTFRRLGEIGFLRRDLRCRHIFKNKRHKEPTEQAVCADVIVQEPPLASEFLLDATYENFDICHSL